MEILEKKIETLLPGDIILHPIFRPDGLILITRYRKITPSILHHLKVHCDRNFPILAVESESDLITFFQTSAYQGASFIQQLKGIYNEHKQYLGPNIRFESYTEYARPVSDSQADKSTALLRFLLMSPLWTNLEMAIVSPPLVQRARNAKLSILQSLREDETIHNLFHRISEYHNVLLTHSVNTMCIALSIGLAVELPEIELKNLAFATLFADIGYTTMDRQEFKRMLDTDNRRGFVSQHIKESISIIAESPTCRDRELVLGILDHHEVFDGSGCPNGKKGEEISLFGRIISIAQAYDEFTGGYIKEEVLPTLVSQAIIWNDRGIKWDDKILSAYIYRREFCKVGQEVIFSDHRRGRIIGFENFVNHPLHPKVLVEGMVVNFDSDSKLQAIKAISQ